jgi:hypothetical protein
MPVALGFKLLSFFGLSDKLAKKFAPLGLALIIIMMIGLLVGGFMLWDHFDDKAAVEADRNASKAVAVSKAREADERAQRAATGKSEDIRHGNERAREAASGSDDPLRDALDSLRTEADRDR